MKTTNKDLQIIWDDLQEIFLDYRKISPKHIDKLRRLGFRVVYEGKHPKIYIIRKGIEHCITFCTTPSDKYAGRQILRQIRAVYERS